MKKEIAEEWVKALRSGKYKQGRNFLKKDDKFCCLGVLCEIAAESMNSAAIDYSNNSWALPPSIQNWAEMSSSMGVFEPEFDENANHSLSFINDNLGGNFNEIADIIEAYWEVL